jgi:hypothetical protein
MDFPSRIAALVAVLSFNATTARAEAPAGVASAPPARPTALAQVDGPPSLRLELRNPPSAWTPVCPLPCLEPVPLGVEYRVTGNGVRSSSVMELVAAPGQRVVVEARAGGSQGAYVGGIVLGSAGGVAILGGLFVWLANAVCGNGNECASPGSPTAETAGLAVAGVGLAAVAFGIVLTLSNPRSELTQRLVNTVAAPPAMEGPKLQAALWHANPTATLAPPAATFPVFTQRF